MFNKKLENSVCDKFLDAALVVEQAPEGYRNVLLAQGVYSLSTRNILGATLDVMSSSLGYKSAELVFHNDMIRDQLTKFLRDFRPIHDELRGSDETDVLSRMRFVEESAGRVRARLKLVFERSGPEHMFTFNFKPGILHGFRTYQTVGDSALRAIGA